MKHTRKSLVCLLLVLLLAAAALTGCEQNNASTEAPKTTTQAQKQTEAPKTEAPKTEAPAATAKSVGEGEKLFHLKVVFADGTTELYDVHTDAETVGAALSALNMIAGENGMYDTVCDKTLSWDADQMYWAFYIGEDYASTGLDDTPVTADGSYSLIATKG